jgi:hypothetical protein
MPSDVHTNDTEQRHLNELLAAMRGECAQIIPISSKLTPKFIEEFRSTLLISHYFLKAPLSTHTFESAFVRAARASGAHVMPAPDGCRFWDVEIDGKKISLKSSSAGNLRKDFLHISKLCEAAWIQDMRSPALREDRTKSLFEEYTASVESIIQLRFFKKLFFYELVELPTSLLRQVGDVPRSFFAPDGPTIGIPVGKSPPDFTLKLDRSDAKITLANINKNVCHLLGSWQLAPLEAKSI